MIYLTGLDLNNVVCFKKVSVDFVDNLVYVRGLNLDADPASPTGNGAGKTLMFSALINLLYQTTPLALKKKAKKDILRQRGSSIGAIIRPSAEGPEYEIIQTSNGYKIYEDGNDLELRTIPLAEEFIRKLFPISEIKLYSTSYLSTQRPYLLQRDTDANRLQHVSDIFNLDQYSGIREVLAMRLRSIKDDEIKLSVLSQQLVGIRRKLKGLTSPVTKDEYTKAKSSYSVFTTSMESVQTDRFALSTRQRDLEALLGIERLLDGLRVEYKFKERPDKMIAKLKEQRSASLKWDRWHTQSTHAKSMLKKLDAKLAELEPPELDVETIRSKKTAAEKAIKKAEAEVSELLSAKRNRARVLEELEALQHGYDALGISGEIPEGDHESELAVLRSTLKLEKLLNSQEHSSHCPTCLSELNLTTIKSTVTFAKKKIRRLESYAEGARLIREIEKLNVNIPEFDKARLQELKELITKKQSIVDKYDKLLSVVEKYELLIAQRDEIEIPEQPSCAEPKHSASEIDEYLDLCTKIVEAIAQKDMLLSNHKELADLRTEALVASELETVSTKLSSLDTKFSKLREEQSLVAEKITGYEQYRNTGKIYAGERDDIQVKIDKLTPGVADKKLLEILLKAYGSKGLRATAAESVCRLLQTNLNHYRDLIFLEPFTFEVIASESGISIKVDRNNGKPDSVSDVRNLSGAESNCFQLLCLISLLPLIPDNERVNLVILDEPTSHMDAASRAVFNERFIPVLREVVPSVYVISPHADDVCPNSSEWIVKKQNGISTVTN